LIKSPGGEKDSRKELKNTNLEKSQNENENYPLSYIAYYYYVINP
jgi:hypothetical protein